MTTGLFEALMELLINERNVHRDCPHLLILDGHQSHLNHRRIRGWQQRGLYLFLGIPHATSKLQMLDQTVNRMHRQVYNKLLEEHFKEVLGSDIKKHELIHYFMSGARSALTVENILASWAHVGMLPFNSDKIKMTAHVLFEKHAN